MKTPDGMVYEGDFEDGLPHGKVSAVLGQGFAAVSREEAAAAAYTSTCTRVQDVQPDRIGFT